jgi:hypothetical protein
MVSGCPAVSAAATAWIISTGKQLTETASSSPPRCFWTEERWPYQCGIDLSYIQLLPGMAINSRTNICPIFDNLLRLGQVISVERASLIQ